MEKILLMAPSLEIRGTTVYTLTLARELRLRGYRVAIMSSGGIFLRDLQREKVPFVQAEISGFHPRDILYEKRIRGRVREYNPDLIHITHHSLASIGGLVASHLEIPYVVTIQNPVSSSIRVQRQAFRQAIAISQTVRESAVNDGGLPREKVRVIEYGVPCDLNPPERRNDNLTPVIGTVSYLDSDHGIKYFIHAAKELTVRGVRAHFLIIGSGPFEKKIRLLIRKLALENDITLSSAMPSYRKLVSPIDILVSPILSEGFNLVIMQAMSRALPVVVSAAGGVFSLISDNETGLIVPKKDVSLFASKIQTYLDDKEYSDRIGLNGFRFVQENYPLHRMVDSTLETYMEAEKQVEASP